MTISEFKAFLEGMDLRGHPTEEQWKRIAEKIDALETFKPLGPTYFPPTYTPSIPDTNPLPHYTVTCGTTKGHWTT